MPRFAILNVLEDGKGERIVLEYDGPDVLARLQDRRREAVPDVFLMEEKEVIKKIITDRIGLKIPVMPGKKKLAEEAWDLVILLLERKLKAIMQEVGAETLDKAFRDLVKEFKVSAAKVVV